MTRPPFHPAVARWFARAFAAPTPAQARAWPAIRARRHTLIAAPTGAGKTLAAFLAAIDDLVRQGLAGTLGDGTQVLYVSPLKALSNDIQRNLEQPLAGIRAELAALGLADIEIRTLVRTGDTPAAERERMRRRPPHILVTTPESLYILLTSDSGRRMLATVRSVIVDEIHALAGNKRGAHLALSLERLAVLAGPGLVRIGLSATQRPMDAVARFLVGGAEDARDCTLIDLGHVRARDLDLEVPASPIEAVMSGEGWELIYDRLAELVRGHRTTLVFVNTRRLAERVTRHLSERLGEDAVAAHHGSLAKDKRLAAEQRLKAGALQALVATASLELGIDIGEVDLVCQLGSPRALGTLLQRVGRSGHAVGGLPKGRLFPLSRDDLVECAALLDGVRRGELDRLIIPAQPLDVLAQQIVAEAACREWDEDALYALVRRADPYRGLARAQFDAVVQTLADGFSTRRGRRAAHLHRDAVHRRLRGRRGARLAAVTSGGAIPDTADYDVILEPEGQLIGTLNEDFAVESLAGDVFQLGNRAYRILRVEAGRVRVEDARGQPPNLPFWLGEAPARSDELSASVARLRAEIGARLDAGTAQDWLTHEAGIAPVAAEQIVEYLAAARSALGTLPTQDTVVFERFFDEAGGMQLVIHSPFGGRLNRAWGLALRKRFCRQFNFELQAAATEDAIVLSLTTSHSFPLAEVARYLHPGTVRPLLVQALLDAPMFTTRWRWNATIALALPRLRGGARVPAPLQRMAAEDLIGAVFPEQMACLENIVGDREIPDHPLVNQTIHDCLHEAMDIEALERLLAGLHGGVVRVVTRDLPEPSPLAFEILTARPYAFLDDAPLEERRTQAVQGRRWRDPQSADDLGRLEPEAIARVRAEAWPEARDADEMHDALLTLGAVTEVEARAQAGWPDLLAGLARDRRAACLRRAGEAPDLWVAAERLTMLASVYPDAIFEPVIAAPAPYDAVVWSPETARVELVRGRLEGLGPVIAPDLAAGLGLAQADVDAALLALEAEGYALRGRFTPGAADTEWCERRLLARIHRYTVTRLRQEIEPVAAADFMRFLLHWQHADPTERLTGPDALAAVLAQLEGVEAPAAGWEQELLPARLSDYDPDWLDDLCRSGRVVWARLAAPARGGAGPVRTTPIALLGRRQLGTWLGLAGPGGEAGLSPAGAAVLAYLRQHGASFFDEILPGTGLLRAQVEDALGELVARGLINADAYSGLRALLLPSARRRGGRRRTPPFGIADAGRWAWLRRAAALEPDPEAVEHVARALLRRYGVVCRKLVATEAAWLPPWHALRRIYRRLEDRGELRGGRFVAGIAGEQFALPEAVGLLRELRRRPPTGTLVTVSAADPLNLTGVITPGPRVPALARNRVLYRDGVPLAARIAGEIRPLGNADPGNLAEIRDALTHRPLSPALRAHLRLASTRA